MKNYTQTSESDQDAGVLSSPLLFIRSGYFHWYHAGLGNRGGSGNYWSLRSYSATSSYSLYFINTGLNPQDYSNRGYGFAVRSSGASFPPNPSPPSLILAIL